MINKIDDYNSLIIEQYKNNKITMEEALKYKKIVLLLSKYDYYEDIKLVEEEYYSKYGCTSETDKIKL